VTIVAAWQGHKLQKIASLTFFGMNYVRTFGWQNRMFLVELRKYQLLKKELYCTHLGILPLSIIWLQCGSWVEASSLSQEVTLTILCVIWTIEWYSIRKFIVSVLDVNKVFTSQIIVILSWFATDVLGQYIGPIVTPKDRTSMPSWKVGNKSTCAVRQPRRVKI